MWCWCERTVQGTRYRNKVGRKRVVLGWSPETRLGSGSVNTVGDLGLHTGGRVKKRLPSRTRRQKRERKRG